jgi:predicted ribosome quality control (RQC) complex YloA/Tae2 family protein
MAKKLRPLEFLQGLVDESHAGNVSDRDMALKWKELELVLREIGPKLLGGSIQKIQQTDSFGFGESFVFGGYGQGGNWRLWTSLYRDHSFISFLPDQAKPDFTASPSTFVMVLRKHLIGNPIRSIEQLPHERVAVFHFSSGHSLVLELIPKHPNLILLENYSREQHSGKSLGSFRQISLETGGIYKLPEPPPAMEAQVRPELTSGDVAETVADIYFEKLSNSTFSSELKLWRQAVKSIEKKVKTALQNAEDDLKKAEESERFQKFGKILFSQLYILGAKKYPKEKSILLEGEAIPLDTNKTFSENSEQMFKKAKKFSRATNELGDRVLDLREKVKALAELISEIEATENSGELSALTDKFKKLGVPLPKEKEEKSSTKTAKDCIEVVSSDGFTIYCGRNQEENRHVTFQEAKGNDVWLHVKGMPGAHVVIKSQKNKTVPLKTLLEAAQLTLYYSKIREGKSAEVDYTQRKHVKAIKGTLADVTYTGNKTLYLHADAQMIRDLIARK